MAQTTQYLLSVYQPDGDPPGPEVLGPIMRDVEAVQREMVAAGAWVFSAGLRAAADARVVRLRDGQLLTTDGPFAEGKEHMGGYTVVRVPDRDAALEWAGRLARATRLPIEVREFQADTGD